MKTREHAPRTPKYRRQSGKFGNRAFVEIDGERTYLGDYGTEESKALYRRLVAEWVTTGRIHRPKTAPDDPHALTVRELIAAFWVYAASHYVTPDGEPGREQEAFKAALRFLAELYSDTKAAEFGPKGLKLVRQAMVDFGWAREYVNQQIGRVKRLFKWAASEELIPSSVFHDLQTVVGLQRGRTLAHECEPVQPVSDWLIDQTVKVMTPTVAAMVRVQRLTGMRPAEVCLMRVCDLETTGPVWSYRPASHKTAWRGGVRQVFIGKRAQAILETYLKKNTEAYLFSPQDSEAERLEARHAARKTALSCGNRPGTNRKAAPQKAPTDRYTAETYARAIAYACRKAFPIPKELTGPEARKQWTREHSWSPNQLRHAFATEVRKRHGLEAAQVLLGHSKADVTQVYAERDTAKAAKVAMKIG